MFTVYVLYSKDFDKTYIGFTSNLEQRLKSHNHPENKGWTKRYQPWILVYTENSTSKQAAMKREEQLKSSRGRDFIRKKIIGQY